MKSFSRLLILGAIVALISAACVRPTPRPNDPTVEPTPADGQAEPATAVPPTVAPAVETPIPAEETPAETPGDGEQAPEEAATAVPEETPETTLPPDGKHVVQPGDTLFRLSLIYGVSVEEIAAANGLSNVDTLDVGQELIIPLPGETVVDNPTETPQPSTEERVHIVQPGDNLFRIGLNYGFTVSELADYNGISDPNRIEVGQEIRIPPTP